jgi:hypothetical protein
VTAAVDWAFEQKPGSASAKLVLLTLAKLAEDGTSCIVTQDGLAEATEQSRASVIRAVKMLVGLSLVRQEERRDEQGHRIACRYHLLAPGLSSRSQLRESPRHGSDLPTLQSDPSTEPHVANSDVGDLQHGSDLPKYQSAYVANCNNQRSTPTEYSLFPSPTGKGGVGGNQTPSSPKSSSSEHPRFSEWYNAYPLHKARGAAAKAFTKALGRADPQTLIAAAKRYCDDPQVRRGYAKHPATWLNQDCWLDEPAPGFAATGTDGRPEHGPLANVNAKWANGQEITL